VDQPLNRQTFVLLLLDTKKQNSFFEKFCLLQMNEISTAKLHA